ncbi:MAG: M16 family metallopeptidase [Cyanophyceae cyanobacterium]
MQATQRSQPVHRLVLDNGITLIVVENQATDAIAARLFFKHAGARWEPRERAGVAHLLAAVMTKGTERSSALDIAERVESVGASLGTDAAADYFLLATKTITADFPDLLKLAAEILRTPTFPEAEVALEKRLAQQSIRSQLEQPFNLAFQQLREIMYGEHPYGTSILGTQATVAALSQADLQHYYRTHFHPDRLVISLSGRIRIEEAVRLVEAVFGDWQPRATTPVPVASQYPPPTEKRRPQETQQAIVMLGYLAAAVQSDDYPILKLLNTYLGSGLSSRLFVELREKRGLAYDVSSFYPTRLDPSQFVAYMGTAPQNTAIAVEGLRAEVERCRQLSAEELQIAKNKLLGQYALGKQTNAEIAQVYGWYETLGLGIDFDTHFQEKVAQVTLAAVQETTERTLMSPYISIVGPESAI